MNSSSQHILGELIHLDNVDSTNNYAKKMADEGCAGGTVIIADRQTLGRGRLGRTWLSMDDKGLWMSLLLRPQIKPECASMLTLVAAMSVVEAIREVSGHQCLIKWPNDIILNNKKLCGILTEMKARSGCVEYVVIGIGINLNIRQMDESIKDMATSLYISCGREFAKDSVIDAWKAAWEKYYGQFLKTCDMSGLMDEYNSMLINVNKMVSIESGEDKRVGRARGIDDRGALQVEFGQGLECVEAGEVSVRGLYGYV